MLELIVLAAIAYSAARGVESIIQDRRQHDPAAEKTVKKMADLGPKNKVDLTKRSKKRPGPAEPGGTFSSSAPRAAGVGGKAAVPLAVAVETGSTLWKATWEGYQQAWPEIRRERREKMAERARRRAAEKERAAANRRATDALEKAGPPPPYPPPPAVPPAEAANAPDQDPRQQGPAPDSGAPAPDTSPEADAAREKAARETKEQAAAAEERARTVEASPTTPEPATPAPNGRRHLTAVPTQNGDTMTGRSTLIPEIRTLDGLLNSLALIRTMSLMRAEEAQAVTADDRTLSDRLDAAEAELADLEVDDATLAEIAELRESIHAQSQAAAQYGAAAQDTADHAAATAQAAHKTHGGIAEAVQSSPVEKAAQAGYYNQ